MRVEASLLNLGGLTWRELIRRVVQQSRKIDLPGWAAQLAFFFLLSFFPLLLFLMLLLGYITEERAPLRDALLGYLSALAPISSSQLIQTTVEEMGRSRGGGKLSFGLLAALWAASNGLRIISRAMDAAYKVRHRRSWWRERFLAIGLTAALGALIVTALTLLLYGSDIAEQIAANFGYGRAFTVTWKTAQYPVALLFVLLAFNAIYYFAPNLKDQEWRWLTVGTLVGVALWLAVSFGLRAYLRYFSLIKTTYGSFASVIVLMLWCYLTGVAILVGGVVNAVIDRTQKRLRPAA